jgi:CheY-like chemotaxis protein
VREALRTIPIVAVTSFEPSGNDQKVSAAGGDAHISKSCQSRDPLQIVPKLLAQHSAE